MINLYGNFDLFSGLQISGEISLCDNHGKTYYMLGKKAELQHQDELEQGIRTGFYLEYSYLAQKMKPIVHLKCHLFKFKENVSIEQTKIYDTGRRERRTYGMVYGTEFVDVFWAEVPSYEEQYRTFCDEHQEGVNFCSGERFVNIQNSIEHQLLFDGEVLADDITLYAPEFFMDFSGELGGNSDDSVKFRYHKSIQADSYKGLRRQKDEIDKVVVDQWYNVKIICKAMDYITKLVYFLYYLKHPGGFIIEHKDKVIKMPRLLYDAEYTSSYTLKAENRILSLWRKYLVKCVKTDLPEMDTSKFEWLLDLAISLKSYSEESMSMLQQYVEEEWYEIERSKCFYAMVVNDKYGYGLYLHIIKKDEWKQFSDYYDVCVSRYSSKQRYNVKSLEYISSGYEWITSEEMINTDEIDGFLHISQIPKGINVFEKNLIKIKYRRYDYKEKLNSYIWVF